MHQPVHTPEGFVREVTEALVELEKVVPTLNKEQFEVIASLLGSVNGAFARAAAAQQTPNATA